MDVYDKEIFLKYSKEEINKVNSFEIDHDRDFLFTYAGLRQVCDKYLVQDRSTGGVYETPQFRNCDDCLNDFKNIQRKRGCPMSDDTTTQSASTKSTFPHLSWQEWNCTSTIWL